MISEVDLCRLLAVRGEGWAAPRQEQSNWFLSSCPSIPLGVATRAQSKASGIKILESLSHFRKLVTVLRPILYILSIVLVSCEWIIPMQGKERSFSLFSVWAPVWVAVRVHGWEQERGYSCQAA